MSDPAVVGPATAAAEIQKLEQLECDLKRVITAVRAEQRRRAAAVEELGDVVTELTDNIATLRSPAVRLVSLETYREIRKLFRESLWTLVRHRADLSVANRKLTEAEGSLVRLMERRTGLQQVMDRTATVLLFRRP